MRRAQPPWGRRAKALATCVQKGALARQQGRRAVDNPYKSPEHAWAWWEGYDSQAEADKRQAWREGRLL